MVTVTENIAAIAAIAAIAGSVEDPELPSLTIGDLGILRGVAVDEHGHVDVDLTPTYSGCPAVEVIEHDVSAALADAGWKDVTVRRVLSPAWTTDWITTEGRRKLAAVGIAPPGSPACGRVGGHGAAFGQPVTIGVRCPHCGSRDTELLSQFGSTACKALRRCRTCAEPFDHFKPL
jgi:ring-1,2-phenylacetyl-CoA epoxidase subunit PaaD